jgi:hypothetical protein
MNDPESNQKQATTDSSATDAIIRYTKTLENKKSPTHKSKADTETRKSADIMCDGCGMHGHGWKHCDFCAKILKSLEFLKGLDLTKKKDLLETFDKEQQRKRANKLKNPRGHIRFLTADDTNVDHIYDLLAELEEDQHNNASDTEQTND